MEARRLLEVGNNLMGKAHDRTQANQNEDEGLEHALFDIWDHSESRGENLEEFSEEAWCRFLDIYQDLDLGASIITDMESKHDWSQRWASGSPYPMGHLLTHSRRCICYTMDKLVMEKPNVLYEVSPTWRIVLFLSIGPIIPEQDFESVSTFLEDPEQLFPVPDYIPPPVPPEKLASWLEENPPDPEVGFSAEMGEARFRALWDRAHSWKAFGNDLSKGINEFQEKYLNPVAEYRLQLWWGGWEFDETEYVRSCFNGLLEHLGIELNE